MPTYLSPGVYVNEVAAGTRPIEGVGTAVAAFVGLAERGPENEPILVSNWSQFSEIFGDFMSGSYLAQSVYGYFLNGGGNCYVVRIGAALAVGDPKAAKSGKALAAAAKIGELNVAAKPGAPAGKKISVEIADASGENVPEDQFKLVVTVDGRAPEVFDNLSTKKGANNVATKVSTESKLILIEDAAGAGALARPANGSTALAEGATPAGTQKIDPKVYVGDPADRTGFSGLEAIEEITMVAVPDLMAAYEQGAIDAEGLKAVQLAQIAHCELMGDRMAVLDTPPNLNAQQVAQWRSKDAGYDSKFAALYWPWVKVLDPATGAGTFVPPSGHVSGVWARSDVERGVHKAPANEVIRGVLSLQTQITPTEQELLNPSGINCLRSFAGRGIRVWGARTLSSDAEWRYLNVRRLFNYLEESILVGTQWAVFEPNDPALWARIRRTISAFLTNEWRKGAVFGMTPEEAFFVKCDAETNPAESIDAGQVVCQVGIAPVKPAEFVIFQLSQFSGGTSLVSE